MLSTHLFLDLAPVLTRTLESAIERLDSARERLQVNGAGAPDAWEQYDGARLDLISVVHGIDSICQQIRASHTRQEPSLHALVHELEAHHAASWSLIQRMRAASLPLVPPPSPSVPPPAPAVAPAELAP